LVSGPQLDSSQTGYGPGYRIYEGSDHRWLALVIPDRATWGRLRNLPEFSELPADYVPLRFASESAAMVAEGVMEEGFKTRTVSSWVELLRDLSVPVESIPDVDRDAFRRGVLDDPVNRQLGRLIGYGTAGWGVFEQIGSVFRFGPGPQARATGGLPGIGEHTEEVLAELGFDRLEIDALVDTEVVALAAHSEAGT
jgi:crotonobetainyl-CoA:carnitine CoA-transferase CaiB-like acyl-CoA transferase